MPANRFAFPVGVRGHVDGPDLLGGVTESLDGLLPSRDKFVRRDEPLVHIHAQLALGQVTDMTHRGQNLVVFPKVLVDGLRLRRRLHHNQ